MTWRFAARCSGRRLLSAMLAVGVLASNADAQQLDRSKHPVSSPPPHFVFPAVQRDTLANGLVVEIVEDHALPLVAVRAVIEGGSLLDPVGKQGLFTLDTLLLRDGTSSMSGDQLAAAIDELGAAISPTRFTTVSDQFERALSMMGDMLMHPAFSADAVERRKAGLLAALQRDEGLPSALARRIFNRLLYGPTNPLAASPTAASVGAISRADVEHFHSTVVRPQNMTLVIVGDLSARATMPIVEKVFGGWERTGERLRVVVPPAPAPNATTIYLYDRPGSPQSTIFIGHAGPSRASPDFYAIETLGALFGGGAGSRTTRALREQRPLTYGVTHSSLWRGQNDPSAFMGSANVDAVKTDSALIVWFDELKAISGPRPATSDELAFARSLTIGTLATRFETFDALANQLSVMARDQLPTDYFNEYTRRMSAVTTADVAAVAPGTIDPSHTTIVVVGDRTVIEPRLRATNIAPVVIVDDMGKPRP
jgi:zinc protease